MRWFNNLSIRVKVLSISFLSLFGFLLYLGINYYATRDVAVHLQAIQHTDVPALEAVNSYTVQLNGLKESYAQAMTKADRLMLAKAESSADVLQEQLSRAQEEDGRMQQLRLLDGFREYNRYADSLARDIVSGRLTPDESAQRMQLMAQMQRDFDAQMESYKAGVYQGFSKKIGDVRQRNDDVWLLGLILGTVLAIVVVGLTLLITNRMIIMPLTHAVEASNKIAEGDWSISIVTAARDELGNMLRSIQKMRDRLKSRFDEDRRAERIKTAVTELANQMRGELSTDQLAERMLNYLVPALRGQVGLFYLPDGKDMVLKGSYAFTWRKNLSNRIPIGEGLVGQAAIEKKQIVLTRVPDDYIVVSSGLGETTPRHIVVTPILHEGELCGMLEIGSLDVLGTEELEILNLSVEHIAIAMSSAMSRMKLSEMLQQTQKQAEQLKRQQDDMQEINDDLEEQAQALLTSELKLQEQQGELRKAYEELEEQAQALRASEESLQAQQEELRVINEELEAQAKLLADQRNELLDKNEALHESQKVLEERTSALEMSSKYKSEFLSTMSHELRTPLNSILILSNSLADNKHGNLNDKQVEHAKVINSAGSDLLSLINVKQHPKLSTCQRPIFSTFADV